MTRLETERLIIRNFRSDDWEALHTMINQYAASKFAAYDHQWPTSPEEIRQIAAWFAGGDDYLAVCLKESGRLIGLVSLSPEQPADGREFNLGYMFNFDYHGHGYATEACRAVIGHAFTHLQAQRVITGTAAANRASCRLLEKLGFRKTTARIGSFGSRQDGKPLEFLGYRYVLASDEWAARSSA